MQLLLKYVLLHISLFKHMGTVLHTWLNGRFVQDGFRSKETLGHIKEVHVPRSSLSNGLYIYIYGFQSIDRVMVKSRKRKLASFGNSMPFISTGTKRGTMVIEKSNFVLVAFNVTSDLSSHSTILHRSNSSSPADSTFSEKTDLPRLE